MVFKELNFNGDRFQTIQGKEVGRDIQVFLKSVIIALSNLNLVKQHTLTFSSFHSQVPECEQVQLVDLA